MSNDSLTSDDRCECAARYGRPWHRHDCPARPEAERRAQLERDKEYAASRLRVAQEALDEAEREYGKASRALEAASHD